MPVDDTEASKLLAAGLGIGQSLELFFGHPLQHIELCMFSSVRVADGALF